MSENEFKYSGMERLTPDQIQANIKEVAEWNLNSLPEGTKDAEKEARNLVENLSRRRRL